METSCLPIRAHQAFRLHEKRRRWLHHSRCHQWHHRSTSGCCLETSWHPFCSIRPCCRCCSRTCCNLVTRDIILQQTISAFTKSTDILLFTVLSLRMRLVGAGVFFSIFIFSSFGGSLVSLVTNAGERSNCSFQNVRTEKFNVHFADTIFKNSTLSSPTCLI